MAVRTVIVFDDRFDGRSLSNNLQIIDLGWL